MKKLTASFRLVFCSQTGVILLLLFGAMNFLTWVGIDLRFHHIADRLTAILPEEGNHGILGLLFMGSLLLIAFFQTFCAGLIFAVVVWVFIKPVESLMRKFSSNPEWKLV